MLRVLVVDDCQDGANTLAALLRLWGHEVQVAYDGLSAFRLATVYRPEVFLLDLALPKLDGCQLARKLRSRTEFPSARLVAVSGFGDPDHRTRAEQAGFDLYLVKPVELDFLQELLARWGMEKHPAEELSW